MNDISPDTVSGSDDPDSPTRDDMSPQSPDDPGSGPTTGAEELAQAGGVGIAAGEPSTFEPEEDPDAVDDRPAGP